MTNTVTHVSPCPACHRPAVWYGEYDQANGTRYRIACPHCDTPPETAEEPTT